MQYVEKLIDVDKDIRIELYSYENLKEPQILVINDTTSIEKSNYNLKIPTRIFMHGFQSHGDLTKIFIDGIVLHNFIICLNLRRIS